MKYCTNCGSPLNDDQKYCLNCGFMINSENLEENEDKGSVGFAILSFFIPIIGLIIFLMWHEKRPKTAKQAGFWALIGFVINILVYRNIL
ncbi:MAG TPA: zinc-ribbon domain-containing protein [Acholeplasma sp.]|nr:zinc-ribbon domain-containing protein [Acholeplasma sp.]